jgi:hypothetical protein
MNQGGMYRVGKPSQIALLRYKNQQWKRRDSCHDDGIGLSNEKPFCF